VIVGYDLQGPGGAFHWSSLSWIRLLRLARRYGWRPAGTEPNPHPPPRGARGEGRRDVEDGREGDAARGIGGDRGSPESTEADKGREWSGTYFWSSGRRVTTADALGLADALEAALPDLPPREPGHKLKTRFYETGEGKPIKSSGLRDGASLNLLEWFSGKGRQRIRDFIRFCRAGGFVIQG
jgi:hypothetical protein